MIIVSYEDDVDEIYIEFDSEGARELSSKFEVALSGDEVSIDINSDSYLDIDKPIKKLNIINGKEYLGSIEYSNNTLKFNLHKEVIEEFIRKTKDYYINGEPFWPAEVCWIKYKGIETGLCGATL